MYRKFNFLYFFIYFMLSYLFFCWVLSNIILILKGRIYSWIKNIFSLFVVVFIKIFFNFYDFFFLVV